MNFDLDYFLLVKWIRLRVDVGIVALDIFVGTYGGAIEAEKIVESYPGQVGH